MRATMRAMIRQRVKSWVVNPPQPQWFFNSSKLYRDRGDCENSFDELKNHWGWGGFTTHDLTRCRTMARIVALIFNWWNLFVRLAEPDHHREAITSRPLLLQAIGRRTNHAGRAT